MNKRISFKLFLSVLWRVVCQVFAFIGKFFGYKDKSPFFKTIWRMSVTCMAILLFMLTFTLIREFLVSDVFLSFLKPSSERFWYNESFIARDIYLQHSYEFSTSRLYDYNKKKEIQKDVQWVVAPSKPDSLYVFAKDNKRGYLNVLTSKVQIPADTYDNAWIFSEGVAAVVQDNILRFIDPHGNIVIDKEFKSIRSDIPHVFHNGFCVIEDDNDGNTLGLIDKQGKWIIKPSYESIEYTDSVWLFTIDSNTTLMTSDLERLAHFQNSSVSINNGILYVENSEHSVSSYDLEGNMIDSNLIDDISQLTYDTQEIVHEKYSTINEESECVETGYTDYNIKSVATCMRYRSAGNWYGLMLPNGKCVTKPLYSQIEAVGKDLYICYDANQNGILLDSNGRLIE